MSYWRVGVAAVVPSSGSLASTEVQAQHAGETKHLLAAALSALAAESSNQHQTDHRHPTPNTNTQHPTQHHHDHTTYAAGDTSLLLPQY
jgi:hypothetical protein